MIWLAPNIALIPIAAPICVDVAPITGAITATAEFPHMSFWGATVITI